MTQSGENRGQILTLSMIKPATDREKDLHADAYDTGAIERQDGKGEILKLSERTA